MSTYSSNFNKDSFPAEHVTVEKKGQSFTGEKQVFSTQNSGQAYNAFPTESTAVPKKGKPWVPKTQPKPEINSARTGGMEYLDPVAQNQAK